MLMTVTCARSVQVIVAVYFAWLKITRAVTIQGGTTNDIKRITVYCDDCGGEEYLPRICHLQIFGVYFLRCAVYLDLSRSYADVLKNLTELGCSDTVLSTDCGNTGLPSWPGLMEEYLQYLLGHGVTEEELNLMTKVNPAQLINLL